MIAPLLLRFAIVPAFETLMPPAPPPDPEPLSPPAPPLMVAAVLLLNEPIVPPPAFTTPARPGPAIPPLTPTAPSIAPPLARVQIIPALERAALSLLPMDSETSRPKRSNRLSD